MTTATLAPGIERKPAPARMPRQLPYIVSNEACERFSFYGMRNILVAFLAATLFAALPEKERNISATEVFHTFVIGVYFFPLLGGWLADRFFGKYTTILWFSVIYSIGLGFLVAYPYSRTGLYLGLGVVALGSGGIKPLVASFMGDQFDARTKHLAKIAFDAFYWSINLGSFAATLTMPWSMAGYGPRITFAIPGVLMITATLVFYAGRKRYVLVPPTPPNPDSFLRVVRTALTTAVPGQGRPGLVVAGLGALLAIGAIALWVTGALDVVPALCLALVIVLGFGGAAAGLQLERARGRHPDEAVDGVRGILRVLILFALITPFWSLFDQKASTWVLQANHMIKPAWLQSSHMQAVNPFLVMILIPFNNTVLFPWLRRRGWQPTALRRMTVGIALTSVSWIIAAILQLTMDGGTPLTVWWQLVPYVFLTSGEVLVSATGLEFAYSQAPPAMKGAVMSFFNLTFTVGSLWVLLANAGIRRDSVTAWIATTGLSTTAFYMFFFAAFAAVAALAFGLVARRYREVDHYRT